MVDLLMLTYVFNTCTGKPGGRGKIHLMAEELQDNKFDIYFELSASKLEKKDLFGKVCSHIHMYVYTYVYTFLFFSLASFVDLC